MYIPTDFHTKRARGFAFIEFINDSDAQKALKSLDGTQIGGREVSISMAQQQRKSPDEMRKRDESTLTFAL